jgi:hypothetical protein
VRNSEENIADGAQTYIIVNERGSYGNKQMLEKEK